MNIQSTPFLLSKGRQEKKERSTKVISCQAVAPVYQERSFADSTIVGKLLEERVASSFDLKILE